MSSTRVCVPTAWRSYKTSCECDELSFCSGDAILSCIEDAGVGSGTPSLKPPRRPAMQLLKHFLENKMEESSQVSPARSHLPSALIKTITTDEIVRFYLNDDFLFATVPGKAFDVREYMEALCHKVSRENPGQIFMHPEDFQSVRTTPGELGLLISQGMASYKNVSGVTTIHFERTTSAAMTYAPQGRVVLQTVEIKDDVLQKVDINDVASTACVPLPPRN